MTRAKIAEVKKILPITTGLEDDQVQAAIDAATCVVDQAEAGCSSHLTTECLKQVEIYLSAHFAAATEFTLSLSSEKDTCTGASVKYGFEFGEGVKGSPFGQMANMLSGGCLAEQDKQPVNLFVIGEH